MIGYKRNTYNFTKEYAEKLSDLTIEEAKKLIPENYTYEFINIDDDVNKYIEDNIKIELLKNSETLAAREYRTFGGDMPKKDLEKFPILKEYKGRDISYIVYESIEIL